MSQAVGTVLVVVTYLAVGRFKYRLDHTVINLGLAMFVFNVSSTFCQKDFDGSVSSNFRSVHYNLLTN